jgi:hypothetical protein
LQPLIVILPDPTNDSYLKGFWSVEDIHNDGAQKSMKVWDYVEGKHRTINLPARMKVVHIKGAGGKPDGKWDKWAKQ